MHKKAQVILTEESMEVSQMRNEIERLKLEISYLKHYGNKDSTALAYQAMAEAGLGDEEYLRERVHVNLKDTQKRTIQILREQIEDLGSEYSVLSITSGLQKEHIESENKRLSRKLLRRDKRIKGLERRIQELEKALALRAINSERLTMDITKAVKSAVQEAICNTRSIPVFGLGAQDKIVEVKVLNAGSKQ